MPTKRRKRPHRLAIDIEPDPMSQLQWKTGSPIHVGYLKHRIVPARGNSITGQHRHAQNGTGCIRSNEKGAPMCHIK